ncbi:MAG: 2,3-bisphosphoglycerate-independent phosphoglycerate mutase [Candidatus Schekmanbacteria bacterium]|nr:2,3-bisphosphoglycerate-independent phosphoglycerate mutase [Candidatus Schekmanbacteria bacterium]
MSGGLLSSLVRRNASKIVFLVLDGAGGLPYPGRDGTALEVARIPNLDALARESVTGLLDPVGPGITPGSGPGHLSLFGYDPVRWQVGRGVLAALGVGIDLQAGDVAVRINFATFNSDGTIADRRAGRIDDATNRRLVDLLRQRVNLGGECRCELQTVKEHRAVMVLRGDDLGGRVTDTDPQAVGAVPIPASGADSASSRTAELANELAAQAREILSAERQANGVLMRGFASFSPFPSVADRYGLSALAVARYPDYRGVAKLVGMTVLYDRFANLAEQVQAVRQRWNDYDFFFVHEKAADARGEDGDFDGKVKVLEDVDALVPEVRGLGADVLVVTSDHSTPALMKAHSFHPVPIMLNASVAFVDDVHAFSERACGHGGLGRMPMQGIMRLALAHAGRLAKFGA